MATLRSRLAQLALLCLVGCQAVYGIDVPHGDARVDGPPDGPAGPLVTGTYALHYRDLVGSDGTLAPPATEIFSATALHITAVLDDGTAAPVAYDAATGAFSFHRATTDQGYSLTFERGGASLQYHLFDPQLALAERLVGHRPAPQVVADHTEIEIRGLPIPAVTQTSFQAATTGVWSQVALPGSSVIGTAPFSQTQYDWHDVKPGSGPLGLLDKARGDTLYVLGFEAANQPGGNVPRSFTRIITASATQITQAPGATTTFATTPTGLPTSCVHVQHAQATESARLVALEAAEDGSAAFTENSAVQVFTQPAPELGILGVFEVAGGATGGANVEATPTFGVPFPITTLLVGSIVSKRFSFPGTQALSADSLAYFVAVPREDCATAATTPAAMAGTGGELATQLVLASSVLVTDGLQVLATDRTVPLTWTVDAPDPALTADTYTISVDQIDPGSTDLTPVLVVQTTRPALAIPTTTFVAGKTYAIRIDVTHGIPNAAHGDWTVLAPDLFIGSTWSRTFTVKTVGP